MERTVLTLDDLRSLIPTMPDRGGFSSDLYLCKSGPLSGQFGIDTLSEPSWDTNTMTVKMRISTSQLDRVNHVVRQEGIKLDFYKDNPVVLFGHGMEGIVFPVAMSEDKDGELTVCKCEDGTYATAHHSTSLKFSSQMFDLVVQKFIRASSIGITPIVCSKGYDVDGEQVLFIDEGQLNEWSYCTIGVNPGARIVKSMRNYQEILDLQCEVANRILLGNRLDGTEIHPVIRKSLQASVVVKASTPGIKPEETVIMKKLTIQQVREMKPKQIAKAMMELKEYDEETQGVLKAAVEMMPEEMPAASAEATPAAGPEQIEKELDGSEEVPSDEPAVEDDTPLGAKVLRSIYEGIGTLVDTATKALGPVEAPEVKDGATEILTQIRDLATSLEGVFSGKYPDQPALAPAMEEPSEDVVKSFLISSNRGRDQLIGLASRIEMVAKSVAKSNGKVSVQHLKLLSQTASDLGRLNQQAKSFKPAKAAVPVFDDSKYRKAFGELKSQFDSLVATLGEIPAPMPKK